MGRPLSRVLPDFRAAASVPLPEAEQGSTAAAGMPCPSCEAILAARLREAHASGEEAGRSAARAEHELELAGLRARAEEHLAEERRRWATAQGDELATRLTAAVEALEARIAGPVARVLTPFATAGLREMMVRDLSESVSKLLSGGRHVRLLISGPDDLLGSLRDRLGACPAAIEWEPNEQVDVTLVADDSTIETDIESWIERFAEAAR